jgi:hypothetical protein
VYTHVARRTYTHKHMSTCVTSLREAHLCTKRQYVKLHVVSVAVYVLSPA